MKPITKVRGVSPLSLGSLDSRFEMLRRDIRVISIYELPLSIRAGFCANR